MAQVKNIKAFRRLVFSYYRKHGRHTLPWRKTKNPYNILVSEVMLQQTQVARVIPYYRAWMQEFKTVEALAAAPLSRVLQAWQGLGYNRRAKYLHKAAQAIVSHRGFPKTIEALQKLPGVGCYTAAAVATFSYNKDAVLIETNIRTAVLHHFFSHTSLKVKDTQILHILSALLPKGKGREWNYALMDYGAHLKRSGVRLNAKVKGYKKQGAFRGSSREVRGEIIKALSQKAETQNTLLSHFLPPSRKEVVRLLGVLLKEGMVEKRKKYFRLPK